MTVLVFGKTGQVAKELGAFANAKCLSRQEADLTDPDACAARILEMRPAAVINAAAYTAVDKAEDDFETAMDVNAVAPGAMARVCASLGIPFVSISTDYVFDGSGARAWAPSDATGPLGAYGASKLAGEKAIVEAGGTWAILRTSWVFSAQPPNFMLTMLRLAKEREALNVVADQIGGPTPARDIAQACMAMVEELQADPAKGGIYHYAGAPAVSWADFAREIFDQAGADCQVNGIPTSDYPTPATRPLNSRLDCSGLAEVFGIPPADWRAGIAAVLNERAST